MKTQLKFKDSIIPGYFIDENGTIYDSENNIQETVIGRGRPCFKGKFIHQLIVHSFIGYKRWLDIHHLNENKFDNRLSNLIYLTKSEHANLHGFNKKIIWTKERRQKMREANLGKNNPMFGKTPWNKGENLSEETKKKLSESLKGKAKGKIWINNGVISKMVSPDNIPTGFVKGRLS